MWRESCRVEPSKRFPTGPTGWSGLPALTPAEGRAEASTFSQVPPRSESLALTLDQVLRAGKRRTVHREPAEIRGQQHRPNGRSRDGKLQLRKCVRRPIRVMSIRYNR